MKGGSAAIMIAQVLQVQQAASGSVGVPANAAYIYDSVTNQRISPAYIYDSSTGLVITYALIYSI